MLLHQVLGVGFLFWFVGVFFSLLELGFQLLHAVFIAGGRGRLSRTADEQTYWNFQA